MIRNKAFVLVLLLFTCVALGFWALADQSNAIGSTYVVQLFPVSTDIGDAKTADVAINQVPTIEIIGHDLTISSNRSDAPNQLGATWVPEVAFPLICHLDTTNNLGADKLDVSLDTWSQGVDYNVICPSNNQTIIS